MNFGKRMVYLRLKRKLTQQDVSLATGLAVSYISRLENNHVTPTIGTLAKVAKTLRVPIGAFFEEEPRLEPGDRCPVSASGQCVLDLTLVGRGPQPTRASDGYTLKQLEILQRCDDLLHSGDRRIVDSLAVMMESLSALVTGHSHREHRDDTERHRDRPG